jgi:c-di-GMP-binding flagellar brake protein YcgR
MAYYQQDGNRRQHQRHEVRLAMKYRSLSPPPGKPVSAQLLDFSDSGLRFRSDVFLPHRSPVLVEFQLPADHQPVRIVAQVVRTKQHRSGEYLDIGLRFRDDLPQVAERLATYTAASS